MPFSVCAQPPIPHNPALTRRSRLLLLPAAQESQLPGLGILELGKASVLAKRRARTPGGYISQEERDERRARLFQHSEANHVAGLISRGRDPFRPASLRRMGLRSPPKKRGGGEQGPKQARRPPTPLEMLSGPSQR